MNLAKNKCKIWLYNFWFFALRFAISALYVFKGSLSSQATSTLFTLLMLL